MGNDESTMGGSRGPPTTLSGCNLKAVADYIKSGQAKRIVIMTGAGISTAAGIPDFRSPGTGLYANLARLNLPYAEAVFDIEYFQNHPEPFYYLAKELYPGQFQPTVSHAFIALLARKGLLLMNFTQNIDCLERQAGVPPELIIEAHGSFATQRCIECKTEFPDDEMLRHVEAEKVARCKDKSCKGLVKPDIVFFGEALPKRFRESTHLSAIADLVLVIGTSLTVYPFAGLPEYPRQGVPRVLFNKERVGEMGTRSDDVLELGACDDGVRKLASLLGWGEELEELWRGVVGEKEAERQLARAEKGQQDIEDEVKKLTEEVESALKLDGAEDKEDENAAAGSIITAVSGFGVVDDEGGSEDKDATALRSALSEAATPASGITETQTKDAESKDSGGTEATAKGTEAGDVEAKDTKSKVDEPRASETRESGEAKGNT